MLIILKHIPPGGQDGVFAEGSRDVTVASERRRRDRQCFIDLHEIDALKIEERFYASSYRNIRQPVRKRLTCSELLVTVFFQSTLKLW